MILLSIGYSKKNKDVYDRLQEVCYYLKDKNVNAAIVEGDVGSMHYIKCVLRDTQSDIEQFELYRDLFYSYISNIIYGLIAEEYEVSIVKNILMENYNYLEKDDIKEIQNRCIAVLLGTGIFATEGMAISIGCKNDIIKRIEDFLEESVEIILDGFVTFRLKDIKKDMEEIVDSIVEEYVLEREYTEFVKLLKYFVDIQESKYECINLIIGSKGEYTVEDEEYKDITKEFFEDFDIQNIEDEVNRSDMLVSALITCAPKKIVIHGINNCKSKEVIDTVKSIFGERFCVCKGCNICNKIDIKVSKEIIKT